MAWSEKNIPDLSGRVAVVTGANIGLGRETARALAAAGAHVVMAARNLEAVAAAQAEIVSAHPQASTEVVECDLASLASVRAAARAIASRHEAVDILVNNAGVMAAPEGRTEDGFETQFGVNHLGHWALTAQLMPALLAAEAARVVTVTSFTHHNGKPVDPANPNMDGVYEPWAAYGRSKLANYLFGIGLQREFERAGVAATSLIAHPGLSHTNLQVRTREMGATGSSGEYWERQAAKWGMEPDRGALSQLRAATDPQARGGRFYGPLWMVRGVPVVRPIMRRGNDADIATLWEVSEAMTGIPMDVGGAHGAA